MRAPRLRQLTLRRPRILLYHFPILLDGLDDLLGSGRLLLGRSTDLLRELGKPSGGQLYLLSAPRIARTWRRQFP